MGRALALRHDYTSGDLKRLARASRNANQTRRLLALSVIYDGDSRACQRRSKNRPPGRRKSRPVWDIKEYQFLAVSLSP